jgi:hypothetical protein
MNVFSKTTIFYYKLCVEIYVVLKFIIDDFE